MLSKKTYTNGQPVYTLEGNRLTYFYKNGQLKATGDYINGLMEGAWVFYRETGQLWQTAHFLKGQKHGLWIRYDRHDREEYRETFEAGRAIIYKVD